MLLWLKFVSDEAQEERGIIACQLRFGLFYVLTVLGVDAEDADKLQGVHHFCIVDISRHNRGVQKFEHGGRFREPNLAQAEYQLDDIKYAVPARQSDRCGVLVRRCGFKGVEYCVKIIHRLKIPTVIYCGKYVFQGGYAVLPHNF